MEIQKGKIMTRKQYLTINWVAAIPAIIFYILLAVTGNYLFLLLAIPCNCVQAYTIYRIEEIRLQSNEKQLLN